MQTTRVFVAVEVGQPALDTLLRLIETLRSSIECVRWTRPEHMHLTLKFLGDIDNRELPTICESLQVIGRSAEPFTARVRGLGTFPRGKPPRIVWAGLEDGQQQPLATMHKQLDAAFAELGVPREGRLFSPHLTLGRVVRGVRPTQLAAQILEAGESLETQFEVEEVKLLASLKERGGISYEPVCTVSL